MAENFASIGEWVNVTVNDALSPAARGQVIADYARSEIGDADESNRNVLGRVPPRTVYVDGRSNAALESVKSTVLVEWELIGDVLVAIGEMLRRNSPVVSGDYQRAHTLFADGQEIPISAEVPRATEYVFLNPLPYSRRLEVGKKKDGSPFVVQVQPHIYERTCAQVNRRFGNIAKIVFGYRAPLGGKFHQISRIGPLQVKRNIHGQFIRGSHVRAGNQFERALRVPAIIIYTD